MSDIHRLRASVSPQQGPSDSGLMVETEQTSKAPSLCAAIQLSGVRLSLRVPSAARDLNDPSCHPTLPPAPEPASVPRRLRPRATLLLLWLHLPDPRGESLRAAGFQTRARLEQAVAGRTATPSSACGVIAKHLSGLFLFGRLVRSRKREHSRVIVRTSGKRNACPQ